MFIKLTRFDNRPVWLNASFIVTVEPRRDGKGAVVVPIGDGLDYDVRETPEEVLRMLDGAPVPTVVPVPVSDCLAPTPADVSPEPERQREPERKPAVEATAEKTEDQSAEAKPKKRATRTRKVTAKKAKASAEEQPTEVSAEAPAPAEVPAEKAEEKPVPPRAELELSETDVVRLRKLAPKSLAKLKNTLATQFRIADVGANVAALAEKGVLTIDGNRVLWAAEPAEQA